MAIHNLFKVCSVLPALLVMPAMAETITVNANEVKEFGRVTISGNSNPADGGALIAVGMDKKLAIGDGSVEEIANVKINGTTFTKNTTGDSGGAIVAKANSLIEINNATFKQNSGQHAGAIFTYSSTTAGAEAAGQHSTGGVLKISGTTFEENTGTESTGAVALMAKNSSITGSKFINNTAKDDSGALFVGALGQAYLNDVEFIGNKVTDGSGGAISTRKGSAADNTMAQLDVLNSDFVGNTATTNGGAIENYLYDSKTVDGAVYVFDTDFEQNSAAAGGAIYNHGEADLNGKFGVMQIVNSDFEKNTATGKGGAIYNAGTLTVTGGEFESNLATEYGGAIYALGGTVEVTGTEFTNNEAKAWGGAIHNDNACIQIGADTVFTGNKAAINGGAISNNGGNASTDTPYLSVVGSTFTGNTAAAGGGALYYSSKTDATSSVDNSVFDLNKSLGTYVNKDGEVENDNNGGGAIHAQGQIAKITNSEFKNNTSKGLGGAISTWEAGAATSTGIGSIIDTSFTGNTSTNAWGGALANTATIGEIKASAAADRAKTAKTATFSNNTAVYGGAIANMVRKTDDGFTDVSIGLIDGYTFAGNKAVANKNAFVRDEKGKLEQGTFGQAAGNGGAIYNAAVITSMKNLTFSGNSATDNGGAIYNEAELTYGANTFAAGSIGTIENATFTGNTAGVAGGAIYNETGAEISLAGKNTFSGNKAAGKANDIHNLGTVTIASGETTIYGGVTGNGALVVDGVLNMGTTIISQGALTLNGTINADILKNGRDGGSAVFAKLNVDEINVGDNGVLKLNVSSTGAYKMFGGDTIDLEKINAGDIYTISFNDAKELVVATKSVADIAADTGLTENSAAIVSGLANSDTAALASLSLRVQQELANGNAALVETELSKANPDEAPVAQSVAASTQGQVLNLAAGRMSGGMTGRAGGQDVDMGYGMWAQGLFNKSKLGSDFHGYTRGFAIGADALIDKVWTVGVGAAFNNTDVHAKNARDTDIDTTALFIYGQYKPNNWYVNGAVTYSMSDYDEKVEVLGTPMNSDYDVDAFGGQIMTGYDLAFGLTPEAGVRYLHIDEVTSDNGLTRVGAGESDFLTGVVGAKYAFTINTPIKNNTDMLVWRPELRAAATYDFISEAGQSTVTTPGVNAYVLDGQRLSRMGGEFGLGLSAIYHGLEVSVNYELDLHEDYTSQTGMLKFRYDF